MDEFTALAQQVAVGAGDVRGCLIMSRDGLILGGFPVADETVAKPAWLRFAALGEPQKGFVEFPDQLWAYVHRGPYAAFAVAEPSVRPGLLMDRLEQALMSAEEARTRREPIRLVEAGAPSSRPRTPLHPTTPDPVTEEASAAATRPVTPASLAAEPTDTGGTPAGGGAPTDGTPSPIAAGGAEVPVVVEAVAATFEATDDAAPITAGSDDGDPPEPDRTSGQAPTPEIEQPDDPRRPFTAEPAADETEVDRVLLAKEFSGLLQMDEDRDDAGS